MLKKLKDFFGGYEAAGAIEFIIIGLGNPGEQYAQTRHNAGYLALEYIAAKAGVKVSRLKFKSLCGDGMLGGKRVLLLKPANFMNRSGESVVDAMSFYKIPLSNILVLSDDATLPVGGARVRRKGSDGGQKGLRSIIELSGSDDFTRIRIGVGQKPHKDMDLADWVLGKFSKDDFKTLDGLFPKIMDAAEKIINGDIDTAMQDINVRGEGKND